jgi:hypothetical protein
MKQQNLTTAMSQCWPEETAELPKPLLTGRGCSNVKLLELSCPAVYKNFFFAITSALPAMKLSLFWLSLKLLSLGFRV